MIFSSPKNVIKDFTAWSCLQLFVFVLNAPLSSDL